METVLERIKSLNRTTKYVALAAIAVVLLVTILLIVFSGSGKTSISIETSLKEVIASSELRTAEYTYNSIAEIKDGDNTKYYVSYKGTVNAGFDFANVSIVHEDNIIKIVVPEVAILSVKVDTNMEYIFIKEKYDTETTYAEAYNACCKDLEEKARTNQTLLATAEQSAEDTLMALVKPFENQLGEGESFEVVFGTVGEGEEQ